MLFGGGQKTWQPVLRWEEWALVVTVFSRLLTGEDREVLVGFLKCGKRWRIDKGALLLSLKHCPPQLEIIKTGTNPRILDWYKLSTPCPFLSLTSVMWQHSVTVGPHTIEWCLYVMTPRLKPDYPEASDITTPSPSPPSSCSSLTIWRLLEDIPSHEFNGHTGCCCCMADSGPHRHPAAVTWNSPITGTALFPRLRLLDLKRNVVLHSKLHGKINCLNEEKELCCVKVVLMELSWLLNSNWQTVWDIVKV